VIYFRADGVCVRISGLLKRDLQDSVSKMVAIERCYGNEGVLIAGHVDKAVTFALVGRKVAHDFDVENRPERTE